MNPIIIVPYRDRAAHLTQFLAHMQLNFKELPICIVEQSVEAPFNRGKLLNIGYLESKDRSHYIFHDVDMLPINVNYMIKYTIPIVQLAGSEIQLFNYLGGVTRFSNAAFAKAGGYNNDYYHRAEDNEMMFNLKRLRMNVINKPGEYKMLHHKRTGLEFDPALWQKAQLPRNVQDQLLTCRYSITHVAVCKNVKHLVVNC